MLYALITSEFIRLSVLKFLDASYNVALVNLDSLLSFIIPKNAP